MSDCRSTINRFALAAATAMLVSLPLAGFQNPTRSAPDRTWTFDDAAPGALPPDFESSSGGTGQKPDGRWLVLQNGRNRVLAQTLESVGSHRLAIERTAQYDDVAVSVRFKGTAGDRAAGVVWRYTTAGDHYLARLNLAQQRASLYKVIRGTRSRIGGLDGLELDPAEWHVVKVEHRGEVIRMWLNGIPVAETRDRTLMAAGQVGVWTSPNSAAWFDDLHAQTLVAPKTGDAAPGR